MSQAQGSFSMRTRPTFRYSHLFCTLLISIQIVSAWEVLLSRNGKFEYPQGGEVHRVNGTIRIKWSYDYNKDPYYQEMNRNPNRVSYGTNYIMKLERGAGLGPGGDKSIPQTERGNFIKGDSGPSKYSEDINWKIIPDVFSSLPPDDNYFISLEWNFISLNGTSLEDQGYNVGKRWFRSSYFTITNSTEDTTNGEEDKEGGKEGSRPSENKDSKNSLKEDESPESQDDSSSGSDNQSTSGSEAKVSGLSAGAKAGIGIGAVLGVAVVAVAIFFFMRYRRQQKTKRNTPAQEIGIVYDSEYKDEKMHDRKSDGRIYPQELEAPV